MAYMINGILASLVAITGECLDHSKICMYVLQCTEKKIKCGY